MHPTANHILVIDDNEDVLQGVSLMLERRYYRVSIKNRLVNFEQEVKVLAPNLILLDKNLGWTDGCEICKALKANAALESIPVIMFSAYYKKKEECLAAGANNFLEKPFQMSILLEMIASYTTK